MCGALLQEKLHKIGLSAHFIERKKRKSALHLNSSFLSAQRHYYLSPEMCREEQEYAFREQRRNCPTTEISRKCIAL